MTASAGPALKQMDEEFGDRVDFLTVYVREAHPGDRYRQPQDFATKLRHAREYVARDAIPWAVAVDDIAGTLHRALDAKPNAAYVMTPDGRIAQRVLWSNDFEGVRRALDAVLEGGAPHDREAKLLPMLRGVGCMSSTLDAAGTTALRDLRREVPPVYLLARTAGVFEPLPPAGRTIAAVATLGLSAAAAVLTVRAVRHRAAQATSGRLLPRGDASSSGRHVDA